MINSPPIYLLDDPVPSDGGRAGHIATGWAPRLEETLSWAAVVAYQAPSQLNFAWDPPSISSTDHVAAQADYGHWARQIPFALFPDLTTAYGTPLPVATAKASPCPDDEALATPIYGAGLRQPWNGGADFCAFVVLINACPSATTATLAVDGLPDGTTSAARVFGGPYTNVTLTSTKSLATFDVVVDGYATTILRVGCPGWKQTQ